jgi:CubicO group peptidase (beta-lactamase class C family)
VKNFSLLAVWVFLLIGCQESTRTERSRQNKVRTSQVTPLDPEYKKQVSARIQNYCEELLDKRGFNGSYLVAQGGNILVEKYVGFVNPGKPTDSLHATHSFHLASVSKTFTAMAICLLSQEGKIDLDATLDQYFAQFPYPGVTVRMLLNHRSGLPNYVHYLEANGWDRKKMVSNLDVLESLYSMRPPLQFPTGKRFSYCNTNYVLLALLIEKTSNQSFPQYLQQKIFEPLQMNHSFVFQPKDADRALPSFKWNNQQFDTEFLDYTYGDKNIYSTVEDMLRWDQGLYDTTMFRFSTLESAFQPYSFEKEGKRNYGLGWRMTLLDNGKKILFHNGWWHGNNTVFIRLLDEKATIIVLGNKFNRNVYKAKGLADYFGDYGQNKDQEESE